ncbi:hypothetical protein EV148_107213 [Dokdonella fugitiva]|jgi:hypothetical protein|uniref:Uncharacterized protein n=2 Tax=Dokdonella fugitiva TaxID=328517 RepID=A0A4R2I8T6_9GAMM|nr:hypothetical protein [Dokdonella fugitiva]MBA8884238.1 hypothetical protein [Dokdonella fugitiva]TCO38925.1 hypothetical protein EV148_107213 [Dokdonella fugitiva]
MRIVLNIISGIQQSLRRSGENAQVADLQQQCETLVAGDLADGPCRFDPGADVVPFDAIVRPRPAQAAAAPPAHSPHERRPSPAAATRRIRANER